MTMVEVADSGNRQTFDYHYQGDPVRALFVISLAGGVVGALLLLATPPTFFAGLVPWLVLFATGIFIWGSFVRNTPEDPCRLDRCPPLSRSS